MQSLGLIFTFENVADGVAVWAVPVCAPATPLNSSSERRTADAVNFMPILL
jgi:hypothetical protein